MNNFILLNDTISDLKIHEKLLRIYFLYINHKK